MQRYASGDYTSWDNKITTPPGLYLLSNIFGLTGSIQEARMINIIFNLGIFLVLAWHKSRMEAFATSMFPISFFFSFLYYTDSGSTFFVLLLIVLANRKRYNWSALAGAVSILFRQTNIVWVLYATGCNFLDVVVNLQSKPRDKKLLVQNAQSMTFEKLAYSFKIVIRTLKSKFWYIFKRLFSYVIVVGAFVIFIVWNGSIALGTIFITR